MALRSAKLLLCQPFDKSFSFPFTRDVSCADEFRGLAVLAKDSAGNFLFQTHAGARRLEASAEADFAHFPAYMQNSTRKFAFPLSSLN